MIKFDKKFVNEGDYQTDSSDFSDSQISNSRICINHLAVHCSFCFANFMRTGREFKSQAPLEAKKLIGFKKVINTNP